MRGAAFQRGGVHERVGALVFNLHVSEEEDGGCFAGGERHERNND